MRTIRNVKPAAVLALLLALFGLAVQTPPAQAQLRLDLRQGVREPIPVAVTPFFGESGRDGDLGRNMAQVIANNLSRSGLFRVVDQRANIQSAQQLMSVNAPRYDDWAQLVQGLVSGSVSTLPDGRMRVDFKLWDVTTRQQIEGFGLQAGPDAWRRIAHKISDAIYKRITGEEGYFDTQIVYISESGPANQRAKRLAIMDQDGENHRDLTDGRALILTPRFSPSARMITYMAYVGNRPRVYLFDIDSGRQEVLGDFPNMTFAPRFSPDGNSVIFSQAQNGNSDIHVMDLRTRRSTRLTDDPAIDTAPSFSPDGRQVVFESDRGGTQQLYIMDAGGGSARRLTFGAGRYASPVWSPRGDLIAFTRIHEGNFHIGVIRPDGTGERMLTSAFHVEGPTWAPNGRVLMFFKERPSDGGRGRVAKLYSVDLTGANEREVITPRDASDPAWSPLIP
ncbi:MAG TPA: Tol-Pal system beta propeller repeat protein TolB [Azospirillaceae bacterium]|nr:Tol-Pal system beta propeller repeat protein TolB [Azospirillaceae bacterium]